MFPHCSVRPERLHVFRYLSAVFVIAVVGYVGQGFAAPQSLLGNGDTARATFLDLNRSGGGVLVPASLAEQKSGPGLFAGRDAFVFRPQLGKQALTGAGVVGLRDLIASAEAGKSGYDAVQYGARIRPGKRPTEMTIGEIYQWIDATPGQPHAIGRYQFIPPTLRRLVRALDLPENTRFSPLVQDKLGDLLLEEAGLSAFQAGDMYQTEFMNNLAKIWAGFPNSSGRSHYHGYAGNKATMTWSQFQSAMDRIFPRG